ncbi:MAG: DUF1501 domain-containing protein [Akkermansiaceae bacterium]
MTDFLTRREMLNRTSTGFGGLALAGLMAEQAGAQILHKGKKAKSVIFCYMSGGVSQVDSFDPKPMLKKMHGKDMPVKVERTQFNNNGKIFGSPFEFKKCGESGIEISSMFPKLREWVPDELAVVRSMTTNVNEHAQGNYAFHTGFPFMGHPSAGAWLSYGLGSGNKDLPGFVVLQSGGAIAPHGGVGMYSNGFLPGQHQASLLKADQKESVPHIIPKEAELLQQERLKFIRSLDEGFLTKTKRDAQVEAAVRNYETAYRMQSAVPELTDLSGESEATQEMYGLNSSHGPTASYGRQALLARRLVEKGVRFVELSCLGSGGGGSANPWDQHGDLEGGHRSMARQVDQPMAALIRDLKERGMLDETIVIWAGEFGRTPFSQGSNGRDHNPYGFSIWMAGGGFQGGNVYGETDDLGYHVVDRPTTVFDLWATVLHQMGIDHEKLTYLYAGRNVRLTDVHGKVWRELV